MFREQDLSDSTFTNSSTSVDLLCKRSLTGRLQKGNNFAGGKTLPLSVTTKKYTKTAPKTTPSLKVGRKQSLVQFLEKQSLFRRKQNASNHMRSFPSSPKTHSSPMTLLRPESADSDKGSGDHIGRKAINTQYQHVYPVQLQQPIKQEATLEEQMFPFKTTASGSYKLKPSQVVYESKNLSIVAADPKNVTLQVTESNKTMETESIKKPDNENWDTTCLFTAVGTESKIPFGSEFSDTISESDGAGLITVDNSAVRSSELSLAKMGYVTDNNIQWKRFVLPAKSELQKLLLQIILNMVNTDIHIKVGNTVFKCHKITLQCYCKYFTSKSGPQVELPEGEVSKEAFALIYQWMLHLAPDSYKLLRRDNILDVFKAAHYLGVKELEDQCWAFIDNVDIFSEDKAFLLYMDARKHNNKDIMELMVPRIQRFFLTLVSSKEFVEFSCEEVCTFLRSNYICIHCEMEVFMAGVRWLCHTWQERKLRAVDVMKSVRFGFINPKVLITMKRNPQSPEFLRVAAIPEVAKMIDDGMALAILKTNFDNDSDEDYQRNLKSLGLTNPVPRNWAGTDKNYETYHEFLRDLAHYRSKQRLEIKRSRMELAIEKVNDDVFLSSAVLPPGTQQKIKKMNDGKSTFLRCLPKLEPKELNLLKKMMCQDDSMVENRSRQIKSKLYSKTEKEYTTKLCDEPCISQKNKLKRKDTPISYDEEELAAHKIQKAYRGYAKKKSSISLNKSDTEAELAAGKIQKAYRGYAKRKSRSSPTESNDIQDSLSIQPLNRNWRSRSDPSIPSGLLRSSTHPPGQCEEGSLPLKSGKDTVFVFGGSNPFDQIDSKNSSQKIFMYQTKTNTWKKCGEMPEPRHFHSVLYFQGKIYVAGGKHPERPQHDVRAVSRKVWRFDPAYMAWARVNDMHYNRRSFGFVACNNKIFAIGGRDEYDRIIANVEKYDVDSDSWVEVRPLNVPRAGPAVCEFNGRIWVAGGIVDCATNIATNGVEYYNFQQNTWTQCTSLRYTLAYSSMLAVQDKLYLVGGAIGLQDTPTSGSGKHIDVWDTDSQTWCLASMMSKPRHAHAAVCLRGQIFILGGMSTKHNCVIDSVECWREEDDSWILGVAPLPHPVSGLAAVTLPVNAMR